MIKKNLHLLLVLPLLSLIWASCEKTEGQDKMVPQTQGEKHEVSFKITAFTQEEVPLSSKLSSKKMQSNAISATTADNNDAIKDYIRRLDFFIYDSSGKLIDRLIRPNEYNLTSKYNENIFMLPEGTYTMIVVGSMGGLKFGDTTSYATAYLTPKQVVEDIFYKEYKFTVNASDIHSNVIKLDRIVGSLEVRDRTYPTVNKQSGLPKVFANTALRYPFDPNGTYQYLYDLYPDMSIIYSNYQLPKISGELQYGRPVDVVYRGFILPNRSGQFNCDPNMYIPASREGDIPGPDLGAVALKQNVKVILTSRDYASAGGEFVSIIADSAWTETIEREFE